MASVIFWEDSVAISKDSIIIVILKEILCDTWQKKKKEFGEIKVLFQVLKQLNGKKQSEEWRYSFKSAIKKRRK